MNQFLVDRIYQKVIPFQSPVKKNKFKLFCDTVQRTEAFSWWKTKSKDVNRNIIGNLTSFSVQSGKVINYEKALSFPLSPVPLSIANVDGSRMKTAKSKLKDIITENTNSGTDENLYEVSRGTAIVDIMPVLNSLVSIPSSYTYEELIIIFVDCLPKELGRVELISDSYSNFSLKREEQEGRGASAKIQIASLKSKVVNNFQKSLLELTLLFFK